MRIKLKLLPLLLFIVACAPMTERERVEHLLEVAQHEPDRIEKWGQFKAYCKENGIMMWNRYSRKCRKKDCIPYIHDWDFTYRSEAYILKNPTRPDWSLNAGNNIYCVRNWK